MTTRVKTPGHSYCLAQLYGPSPLERCAVANNSSSNTNPTATLDEVGIFINSEGDYRVLLPQEWSNANHVPEFAYLVIAALVRLARRDEVEFRNMLSAWARQDLTQSDDLKLAHGPRRSSRGRPN